jgi:hypothetical protein
VRSLVRRWLDNHRFEPEEAAVVGKRNVGGERTHEHIEYLLETRLGLFGRHRKTREFVVAVALAHSQIKPAAREQIQGRNLLCEQHRVVPWQYKNRRAEAKARGASRNKSQKGKRRRDLADASKVVLRHEARMESECFGLNVGSDEIEKALAACRHVEQPRRCGAAEQSKSHGKT